MQGRSCEEEKVIKFDKVKKTWCRSDTERMLKVQIICSVWEVIHGKQVIVV